MDLDVQESFGVKLEDIPLVFDYKVLAKILGVSISTAQSIMRQDGFPVWRISNRMSRIYKKPFLEWLEKQVLNQEG